MRQRPCHTLRFNLPLVDSWLRLISDYAWWPVVQLDLSILWCIILEEFMISQQAIQAGAMRIAEQFKPQKIILFGSYAYGKPNEDSDVDLMVLDARSKEC